MAGGIGQAIVQSAADALLLVAIWRRTGSVWIALAAVILIATSAYDLALAALVWNPMMGAALAKIATALVLLGWPFRSLIGVAVTAAVAWSAVHSYTGAIFTTVGVFVAILAGLWFRGEHARAARSAAVIAIVVLLLQVPIVVYQMSPRSPGPAMSAVTGSVGGILTGQVRPDFANSWNAFASCVRVHSGSALASARMARVDTRGLHRHRDSETSPRPGAPGGDDPAADAGLVGYALFVGHVLEAYYYLLLMPAAVLTVVLGLTAMPSPRIAQAVAVCLVIAALAITPARVRFESTLPRMPEYGTLLDGSRRLVERGFPVRAIRTEFQLPPTADPEFLYRILGGRIEPSSHLTATDHTRRSGHLSERDGQVIVAGRGFAGSAQRMRAARRLEARARARSVRELEAGEPGNWELRKPTTDPAAG